MDDIIRRLMENRRVRVNEMAYDRRDAINRCADLGRQFINHFHKVYVGGLGDQDFKHHCHEMQVWYDDVSNIVLKYNKKLITDSQLLDWFFTKGSSVEYLFSDEDEKSTYEVFIKELHRGDSVEELMRVILKGI